MLPTVELFWYPGMLSFLNLAEVMIPAAVATNIVKPLARTHLCYIEGSALSLIWSLLQSMHCAVMSSYAMLQA